ncbi:hypothetical protein TCAL_15544, partial [Tigriopus californicus]
MCLNPVCGWLLKIFEAQDGSISTVTLIDGDGGPPIPNRTRCVQVSLPDNSNAPKSYGSCSTLWDWSNCSIDFEASSSMSSEYCSPALKEIRCRQQNGFFNFCGRKVCTVLVVSNHGIGDLGVWDYCPNSRQVTQFQIKSAPKSGLTGVKMVCNDPERTEITSHAWNEDSFSNEYLTCPEGYTKIRTRWQTNGGAFVDDHGLTCFELFCQSTQLWQTPFCNESNIDPLETRTLDCPSGQ